MVNVGKPCGSAPRNIRKTLYCCPVISNGAHTVSNSVLILSAVESRVLYGGVRDGRDSLVLAADLVGLLIREFSL